MNPAILAVAVVVYVVAHSLQETANYLSGRSLFDLAVYEQGFWNALGNPPFFYSLEGPMSRFGRHFSPVFYLILPFYLVYPDPITLLITQTLAIGMGAVPLYLLVRRRLGRPFGLLLALAYLLNPAVHDINLKNDFHEISFALPSLLLLLDMADRPRILPYILSLLLALSTREEVSLTTFVFGLYLILARRDVLRGVVTTGLSLTWCVAVFYWVMPAFNVGKTYPLAAGYEYLGSAPLGILATGLHHPSLVVREMIRPPKLAYLFWLAEPVAFLCLLAPDALGVAAVALTIVLASTYPYTYEVFERYAAPIVPFVFYAVVVGVERIRLWLRLQKFGAVAIGLGCLIVTATGLSQFVLQKLPIQIQFAPDARMQAALTIAHQLPQAASVSAADHRWLPHLANRRELYVLAPGSPDTDFVMFDRAVDPITNIAPNDLRSVEDHFLSRSDYRLLRCDEGLFLLGRRANQAWSQMFLTSFSMPIPTGFRFGSSIRLSSARIDLPAEAATTIRVELTWQALDQIGDDYHVFVHLVDRQGRLVAQHDGPPGNGYCSTQYWTSGLTVADSHQIAIPPGVTSGQYAINVGLYALASMQRLTAFDARGGTIGDHVSFPVVVGRGR